MSLSCGKLAPKVVHVSPTYFAPESVIGGGERFAEELSRAMAQKVPVRFVSFGRRALRERMGGFERVILRSWNASKMSPFSPRLLAEVRGASAIHCHQLNTLPTFMSAVIGRAHGIPVFVSDLGGGGWTPGYHVDIGRFIAGQLPISAYAGRKLPRTQRNAGVIYGGVDLENFRPREHLDHDGTVVFLGRILPHKGIHWLIEGMSASRRLVVMGPPGDAEYLARLKRLATGKRVEFVHGLDDAGVAAQLRRAAVLVHPTPVDARGDAGANELLGLAVLEAMASNCPPVVTRAASLPELVEDGISGLIVPPNDGPAIGAAIEAMVRDADRWRRMAAAARLRVERAFTWPAVVDRCLRAYGLRA